MMQTEEEPRPAASPVAASLPTEFFYAFAKKAMEEGRLDLAASHLVRYIAENPDHGQAHRKLGYCYFLLGDFPKATAALRRAVEIRPHHLQTVMMLGHALYTVGEGYAGEEVLRRVLSLEPTNDLQRAMLGQTQLLFGNFADGWVNSEARWRADQLGRAIPFSPSTDGPLWDGRPARDRSLFVYSEGGFGDVLMFSRFLPTVRERVGRVVLQAHPSLRRLLAAMPGVDEIVDRRNVEEHYDLFTSTSSLPHQLEVRIEDLPWSERYLSPPSDGPLLGPAERPRVGLVWAGNPRTRHDPDRSIPDPELLRPLVETDRVEWISLQVGSRAGDADSLGIPPTLPLRDWGDTAFLLSQLDLVVTVDTAVAHLAGAMGIPVWVTLPTVPEFRWLIGRDDTPWYSSMRLFRRNHTADWAEVISRVRATLDDWLVEKAR
jgi:hypothetical protein